MQDESHHEKLSILKEMKYAIAIKEIRFRNIKIKSENVIQEFLNESGKEQSLEKKEVAKMNCNLKFSSLY